MDNDRELYILLKKARNKYYGGRDVPYMLKAADKMTVKASDEGVEIPEKTKNLSDAYGEVKDIVERNDEIKTKRYLKARDKELENVKFSTEDDPTLDGSDMEAKQNKSDAYGYAEMGTGMLAQEGVSTELQDQLDTGIDAIQDELKGTEVNVKINDNDLPSDGSVDKAIGTVVDKIENQLDVSIGDDVTSAMQDAAKAGLELIGSADVAVNAAGDVLIPLLTVSGIGIPLALGLQLLKKANEKMKDNIILNNMLQDCEVILLRNFDMHRLIISTIGIFNSFVDGASYSNMKEKFKVSTNIPKNIQMLEKSKLNLSAVELKMFRFVMFDKNVTRNLVNKMNYFNTQLKGIIPDTSGSRFSKLVRGAKRLLSGKAYVDILLRELTLLNSYFIIYNNQFEWIIRQYEHILKRQNPKKLDAIWFFIEHCEDYTSYLYEKTDLNEVVKDVKKNDGKNLLKKTEVEVEKQVAQMIKDNKKLKGGKSTKKRRTKKKKKKQKKLK